MNPPPNPTHNPTPPRLPGIPTERTGSLKAGCGARSLFDLGPDTPPPPPPSLRPPEPRLLPISPCDTCLTEAKTTREKQSTNEEQVPAPAPASCHGNTASPSLTPLRGSGAAVVFVLFLVKRVISRGALPHRQRGRGRSTPFGERQSNASQSSPKTAGWRLWRFKEALKSTALKMNFTVRSLLSATAQIIHYQLKVRFIAACFPV